LLDDARFRRNQPPEPGVLFLRPRWWVTFGCCKMAVDIWIISRDATIAASIEPVDPIVMP